MPIIHILIALILFIIFVWLLFYFSIFLLMVFGIIFVIFSIKKFFEDGLNYFKKGKKNNFETDFCKVKKHFSIKGKNNFGDDVIIEDAEIKK